LNIWHVNTILPVGWMVDEEVGAFAVDGAGVGRMMGVPIANGLLVTAGFTPSGVDADNVASKFTPGVGVDEPMLQARRANKSVTHAKSFLVILFLNRFKVKLLA
jgi:hypothetical protein